jgi:hypothetical protein
VRYSLLVGLIGTLGTLAACAQAGAGPTSQDASGFFSLQDLSGFITPLDLSRSYYDFSGEDLHGFDLATTTAADLGTSPDLAAANCMHIDQTFATAPTNWTLKGSASYDTINHRLEITPPANHSSGTAFYNTPITTSAFDIQFKYYIGDGTGADGVAFVLGEAASVSQLGPSAAAGPTLGYQGITGYAVEFDTYQNSNDPSANHVAWMQAFDGTHLVVGEPSVPLNCNCERQADIRVTGSHLTVTVDGTKVIDGASTLPNGTYFFGFSGACGLINNRHTVRDVHITLGAVGPCI